MVRAAPYLLQYAPEVRLHLSTIESKHHSLIQRTIKQQLSHTPLVETRNRKPLRRPIETGGDWELRFGPDNRFRVFYDVDELMREVRVLAIGVKTGSRLTIGGKDIES